MLMGSGLLGTGMLIVAVGMGTGGAAKAAESSRSTAEAQAENQAAERREARESRAAERQANREERRAHRDIRGQVERIRKMVVDNVPRLVIEVRPTGGAAINVDLGTAKEHPGLAVRVGDQVVIRGLPSWLGQDLVVAADRITVGGHTIQIRQPSHRIAGEVVDFQYAPGEEGAAPSEPSAATSHLFVQVLHAGELTWVDLGRASELGDVDFGPGDPIVFIGRSIPGEDGRMMVALELHKDNRVYHLNTERAAVAERPRPERPQQSTPR